MRFPLALLDACNRTPGLSLSLYSHKSRSVMDFAWESSCASRQAANKCRFLQHLAVY